MKIFKVVKILREQIEMLAEDSKNCVPGELPQNSNAMAELDRALLTDKRKLCCLHILQHLGIGRY